MKKINYRLGLLLSLLLALAACGNFPEEPGPNKVLRDVERFTSGIFLGNAEGTNEKFPLSPLILEEEKVKLRKGKETIDAEIVAFLGDRRWRSEAVQSITAHYRLNGSGQWEVEGVNVNDPVIRVLPRTVEESS